jgi:hypothetical protein
MLKHEWQSWNRPQKKRKKDNQSSGTRHGRITGCLGLSRAYPTRGVRHHNGIWSKELTIRTILNRLRKLEEGLLPPVETEAGRRVREANERLRQRMAEANARMRALGHESGPKMPELTESERAALSSLTLGQRIRYHTQRHQGLHTG